MFIRFLEAWEENAKKKQEPSIARAEGKTFGIPDWMRARGEELTSDFGFAYAGGRSRCTEGVWIWPRPFIVPGTSGEKIAVLLMDMQGAFDHQTKESQSAALCGLAMLLSDKSMYNLKGNLDAGTVRNLDLFAAIAKTAYTNVAKKRKNSSESIGKGEFGEFTALSRDYPNLEQGWSRDQCVKEMKDVKDEAFNPDGPNGKAVQSLQELFQKISVCCLPHPGMGVDGKNNVSLNNVDDDFTRFVDHLCRETFAPESFVNLPRRGIFLAPGNFSGMIETLVEAFADMNVIPDRLADVIGKAMNLSSKEDAVLVYKSKMDSVMAEAPYGEEAPRLKMLHEGAKSESLKQFNTTTFGDEDEIEKVRVKLITDLEDRFDHYARKSESRLNKILTVFAPVTVLSLLAFAFDFATDYTCDPWWQTCRNLSKVCWYFYVIELLLLVICILKLLFKKGFLQGSPAVLELLQECWKTADVWKDAPKEWIAKSQAYFEGASMNDLVTDLRSFCEKAVGLVSMENLQAIPDHVMKLFKSVWKWVRAIFLALKKAGDEPVAPAPTTAAAEATTTAATPEQ
jgi:atlastin